MVALAFGIGVRPELSETQARELANELATRGTQPSHALAAKIREEVDRDDGEREEVDLELPELHELASVLAEPIWQEQPPGAFAHLRHEVVRELGDDRTGG